LNARFSAQWSFAPQTKTPSLGARGQVDEDKIDSRGQSGDRIMRNNFTGARSKRNPRAPARVNRHQQTGVAIVTETVKILKARDSFNETEFFQYLDTAGLIVAVPCEVTPEWVHSIADHFAGQFARWQARARRAPETQEEHAYRVMLAREAAP
jgi:hypothetical protein